MAFNLGTSFYGWDGSTVVGNVCHRGPTLVVSGTASFTRSSATSKYIDYEVNVTVSNPNGKYGYIYSLAIIQGGTRNYVTNTYSSYTGTGYYISDGTTWKEEDINPTSDGTSAKRPLYNSGTSVTRKITGSYECTNNNTIIDVVLWCNDGDNVNSDGNAHNCHSDNWGFANVSVGSINTSSLTNYVPYQRPTVSISAYNGDTIARADGTTLDEQLQKVSITTSNTDGYTSTTRLTINGNAKDATYGNGTKTGEFYPANYKVGNYSSYTVVANTVHDKKSDYTASASITLYTYAPPGVTATLSTPKYTAITSGNYTRRVSPQDSAKITFTAQTRGWGKSNRENAFQTSIQIGPRSIYNAAVVKDNTASDEIQTWSGEYTLDNTGLATYLVVDKTDYRNNAYYDMDMWIRQKSPSANWETSTIHNYVRMQFRPVKAPISGKVTSDANGTNGVGGKTLNVSEVSTIYTFWDYASATGGAGVVSGYSYTIGTGGTGSSFVASKVSGTTSNKNKSFNTSSDLVRGKMNYIKIVPYYQSPNGTKYYAQNDKGEEQALYFQLIQPVSTLDAPIIDYPINGGTWHNDSIRVCLKASNDPDFSTLGVTEANYRYGDVEVIINDKVFLRSNANNYTMFSATDTSHKGSLVINISEGDGFVKANTYNIKIRFKKNYNLSATDSFNWSPQAVVSVTKTEINELTINKEDIIRAAHFNGIRDAINKSCNCYNKTQTTLKAITADDEIIIDDDEYGTLYQRIQAVKTIVNDYTTYKLEGETYVKFNNKFDQFNVAPTKDEKITAAKNKTVSSATGRNYINLLREALNKLI